MGGISNSGIPWSKLGRIFSTVSMKHFARSGSFLLHGVMYEATTC